MIADAMRLSRSKTAVCIETEPSSYTWYRIVLSLTIVMERIYLLTLLTCALLLWIVGASCAWRYTESFTQASQDEFIARQYRINQNRVFDMDILANQVSQGDLDHYLQTGIWEWSPETTRKYQDALSRNPYVRVDLDEGTLQARKVYNDVAIRLAMQYPYK